MIKYKKPLFWAIFTIFLGAAVYILAVRELNPYVVRNAIIDPGKSYIAGVASKDHWKDYKLFVYDLDKSKLMTKTLQFERDWNTYSYSRIGLDSTPAFSEDSSSIFWLHQNKKYGTAYKLINWNFVADTLIEESKPDRRIFRFQFITPSGKFAWYDNKKSIHLDGFGSSSGESFKPFANDLKGMNTSPDGRLIVTWGDDSRKNGERQTVKIWQVDNGSVSAEHVIKLEDVFADITHIRVRFALDSKTMYLFVNQRWDPRPYYQGAPKICRSYQFNTQNWNQISQFNYDCELTSLQSSVVSDDISRLLLAEYTQYPLFSLREITFEDNGQLIKEYYSIDTHDRRDIAGHFYGKGGTIHAVTSENEIYSFNRNNTTPTIKHLSLNRDMPYWAIIFIIFSFAILIVTHFLIKPVQDVYQPNILNGIVIIYAISGAIVGLALQFAAISSELFWLHLWPAGGFVLIVSFFFARDVKLKALSWVIAFILLFIPTALLFFLLAQI